MLIPEKLSNYMLYTDGSRTQTALVDVDLPELQFMTETISGAGIAGEIESITAGHTSHLTLGLNIRALIGEDFTLLEPRAYNLEIKAGIQSFDKTAGKIEQGKLSIFARGIPKTMSLGKVSVGKATDSKKEFAVDYLKVEYDGEEVLEIDKLNMICKIKGVDYLADLRAAMGM